MIKPDELATERPYGPWACRGCDIWDAMQAAVTGDATTLRILLRRDPNLYRAEYWYTQPIHFAVREGHLEAVRVLLDAGADPSAVGINGDSLITIAQDRGHGSVVQLLADVATQRGRSWSAIDRPIHLAVDAGDTTTVRALLDAEPHLVHARDRAGGTSLHRAVTASAREMVRLLLDRGADIHALHGSGPASERGYAAAYFQPIDLALWSGPFWGIRGDIELARVLLACGAEYDLVIAAALGDLERVEGLLDDESVSLDYARPCGKRALSAAVEFGYIAVRQTRPRRAAVGCRRARAAGPYGMPFVPVKRPRPAPVAVSEWHEP